ncbi:MAG: hypothetical protein U0359_21735 [Byssovorax sp.]
MGPDLRLIEKGKGQPRTALAQEGKVHILLAKQYAAELDEHGWSASDTADFELHVAMIDEGVGSQAGAYEEASQTSAAESDAIDAAKAFLRRLRNALPRALREAAGSGVTEKSFLTGETLERSTPKISTYLSKIRPSVEKLDPVLGKFFGGKKASAELDVVKSELDAADAAQEVARKNAPEQTQALYENMGRVLEGIEDMNRAGRSAFEGNAAVAASFNKDLLLRGRKKRKGAEEGDAGGGAPGPSAPKDAPAPS